MSKTKIFGLISLALMIATSYLPISLVYKVLIIIAIIAFDFYRNRALIYFVQGNKNIMSKKDKDAKAMECYAKAFYTGKLESKYLITMGNIIAQKGDPNDALNVLNSVLERKDTPHELMNQAMVQKSMVLEQVNKIDEAIKLLQKVRKSGYKEKSLYINLACYLLYVGNKKEAYKVLEDGKNFEATNSGVLDNRGWFLILENNWSEASRVYSDLIERNPAFPDPYIHAAQVKLHYNKVDEAIKLLEKSIEKTFNKVSFFKEEFVKEIIEKLSKDTDNMYLTLLNNSVEEIAKGLKPKELDENELKKLILSEVEEEPIFTKNKEEFNKAELNEDIDDIEENVVIDTSINPDDDGTINTDLTDEDEEWEKNHR